MTKFFTSIALIITFIGCGQKTKEIQANKASIRSAVETNNINSYGEEIKRAIDSDDTTFVKKVLNENKTLINKQINGGDTALTYAIKKKNISIITTLIEYSDINQVGKDGQSPLHLSIITQQINIMNILLRKNAKINTLNIFKQTPLIVALTFERENMAIKLLTLGADYSIKDNYNFSALELAQSFRLDKVHKLINEIDDIKTNGLNAQKIKSIIDSGDLNLINYICLKFDLKERANGENILSHAINSQSAFKNRIITTLLNNGLDPNGEENDTSIPLFDAIKSGDLFSVRNLTSYEVDLNKIETSSIISPLAMAVTELDVNMVNFLYKNGAERKLNYQEENYSYDIDACKYLPRRGWRGYREDIKEKVEAIKTILDC
jgi:ankyrin repeat protein